MRQVHVVFDHEIGANKPWVHAFIRPQGFKTDSPGARTMNPSEESTPAPTLLAFWSMVISFAVLAAGLEGLRVDPTFGTGVSVLSLIHI